MFYIGRYILELADTQICNNNDIILLLSSSIRENRRTSACKKTALFSSLLRWVWWEGGRRGAIVAVRVRATKTRAYNIIEKLLAGGCNIILYNRGGGKSAAVANALFSGHATNSWLAVRRVPIHTHTYMFKCVYLHMETSQLCTMNHRHWWVGPPPPP